MTAPLCFITIDNLEDIAAAYGDGAAGRVLACVADRLDDALFQGRREGSVEAWGVSFSPMALADAGITSLQVESVISELSRVPVVLPRGRLVVTLSAHATRPSDGHRLSTCAMLSLPAYRTAMDVAAAAYLALNAEQTHFLEQPIREAGGSGVLYDERLVRLRADDGSVIMPGGYMPALEQLGLTQAFDKRLVELAIFQLRRRRGARLGCNISSLSARSDRWWSDLFPLLLRDRNVAARLFIEITEAARPYRPADVIDFVAAIRDAGCSVALDAFGAGYSSFCFVRDARFDVVKVDALFVQTASATSDDRLFRNLVSLASSIAPHVIVEGVENQTHLELAQAAGAAWCQGGHVSDDAERVEDNALAPVRDHVFTPATAVRAGRLVS